MFLKKNFFGFFAVVNLVIAGIIFSFAIINFYSPVSSKDPESLKDMAFKQCLDLTRTLGVKATPARSGGSITVTVEDLTHWDYQLAASSVIINGCKGFELISYCQSSSCKISPTKSIGGTVFSLKYQSKIK